MDHIFLDEKLKEKIELSILFDFYGELMKNNHKHIFEDYILNDLSLSEIAEEQGISRQGVYDIIKRCSIQLRNYEERLNLIHKFDITKEKVNQIKSLALSLKNNQNIRKSADLDSLEKINDLSESILSEL